MSLESVFGVGQSALVAQTYRLNVIAENLANAEVAAGTPEGAYKGQYPVFRSVRLKLVTQRRWASKLTVR